MGSCEDKEERVLKVASWSRNMIPGGSIQLLQDRADLLSLDPHQPFAQLGFRTVRIEVQRSNSSQL